MSNLKGYQTMTTAAKKVGGPINLVVCIAGAGYAVGRVTELVIKACARIIKERKDESSTQLCKVNSFAIIDEGINLYSGDELRIMEADGNDVLIEIVGKWGGPYIIPKSFLREISDYKD